MAVGEGKARRDDFARISFRNGRRMPASHPRSGAKRKRRRLGRQLGLTTAFNLGRAVLRKSSLSTAWARNSFRLIVALFCFDDFRKPSNTILRCFLHCWLTLRTLFGCCGVFPCVFCGDLRFSLSRHSLHSLLFIAPVGSSLLPQSFSRFHLVGFDGARRFSCVGQTSVVLGASPRIVCRIIQSELFYNPCGLCAAFANLL